MHITDAGSAALAEYSSRVSEREHQLLSPLDSSEAEAFSSMIVRVARAAQGTTAGGICPTADC